MNSAGLLFIQRAKDVGNDNLDHIGCVDHILNICTKKVALDPKIDIDKILEPFMLAQELLEGEKYVTLSLVVTIIEKIRKNLKTELLKTEHSEYVTNMLKVLYFILLLKAVF